MCLLGKAPATLYNGAMTEQNELDEEEDEDLEEEEGTGKASIIIVSDFV